LHAALGAEGIPARTVAWDDPTVEWGAARGCLIRSTWNYVDHLAAFVAWAERCAATTTLWNPLSLVRWNVHKRYLLELAAAGVPVVPTWLVPARTIARLCDVAAGFGDVVVKPAISAGSSGTLRVAESALATWGQAHLERLCAQGDVLVQPYLPSVTEYGERSLIWIDGAITHAVQKHPRFMDDPYRPPERAPLVEEEVDLALRIVSAAPQPALYARVDIARIGENDRHGPGGNYRLMELELIEPALYLNQSPFAAARLAKAIARRL
jgi:glutathione synthase/RimK-type ligase-like ATP-grasp enzyme